MFLPSDPRQAWDHVPGRFAALKGRLQGLLFPSDDSLAPLAFWRERVLRATLVGSSVGGIVPLVPAVIYATEAGQTLVVVADIFAYITVVFLAFRPALPFALRAGVLVAIPLLLAVLLLSHVGSVAAGAAWLTAFPVVAALFFGLRAAALALGTQLLVVVAVGVAVTTGVLDWGEPWLPTHRDPRRHGS